MSEALELLEETVSPMVLREQDRTAESIRTLIDQMRSLPMFTNVSNEEAERLAKLLEERNGIYMGIGAIVDAPEFQPWLHEARAHIDPHYWSRYKKLLNAKRLPADVITSTDTITDSILDRMGNPGEPGPWDRKGMVVGHVQSGKTQNYTGLICKAADAGYRLVVVIAGIHNNLRNQTQARIDEGFVGRDTGRLEKKETKDRPRVIGVGRFDDRKAPVSLTTTLKDFNRATATTNTSQIASYAVPVVLVIKKNSATLANLVDWLKEHSTTHGTDMVDQPMLLIDDEADNASIDIKYGKGEASRINSQIRELLAVFRRSCYVGYTATPFANIFIDPETDDEVKGQDLFPRHFIIGLDAPTNYFGARKVFIDGIPDDEEAMPSHIRYIHDNGDVLPVKHKIDHDLTSLPPSMLDALRTFLVARVIRNLRGQSRQHASMLVNASRFTGVQGLIRNRLHQHLKEIEDAVRVDGGRPDAATRNTEIAEIWRCWAEEYRDAGTTWDEIRERLLPVVASTQVIAVNAASPAALDYEAGGEGQTVIAVGGFSLSRGLTLEGLTTSYFLRNSLMYDTLMQMGRWFGYRPDYEDLCRIWMPQDAVSWYAHIGEATEELQLELKRMQQANATPEEFGLAVRSHPSALMVTARNKMGAGKKHIMVGLSNSFIETVKLSADTRTLDHNRAARDQLLKDLRSAGHGPQHASVVSGGFLLQKVSWHLVDSFLRSFENDRESVLSDPRPVRKYISDRAHDELGNWDILIASLDRNNDGKPVDIEGWSIIPPRRRLGGDELQRGILSISGKKARLSSRGVEKTGLDDETAKLAEARYVHDELSRKERADPGARPNYPDRIYRAKRTRPLLVLYNIELKKEGLDHSLHSLVPDSPVVGWALSFPISAKPDKKVEYILNPVALRELFGDDDDDEDSLDD
ncbi:Z1 domain-containing protein [Sphingomonas sp. MG17]|uniref:Z1 domain-containing protein n=1 Tax=Sphingomonas tagetis TaxID=2949092 RepID=A0A9X2HTB4_9SPHN|nr:Z1 domain-containing protein [Sphingomonas tagetis]MCP3733113.1 Z1 domain-containing protein [Sphingomonas tagetis]